MLILICPFLVNGNVNVGNVLLKKSTNLTTNKILTGTADDQTITFPALSAKVRNDVDFAPGASASSGLTVTYTSSNPAVATIVSNKIRITGVGTTIIRASQAGNASFNPAVPVDQPLMVTMAQQTINFPDIAAKPFNTPNFSPNATASSALTVTYTSSNAAVATIVNSQIHIVGLGTSVITANQAGNAFYDPAPSVSKTLTVDSKAQFITFPFITGFSNSISFTYIDFASPATSTSHLPVTTTSSNPLVATIIAGKIHITGVGTTTLTASQAGDASFDPAADVSITMTVNQAQQTITFPLLDSKPLTAPDFDPGATTNSQLPITYSTNNPAIATIVDGKIHIVGPGVVSIIASQGGNANFAAATNKFRDLDVGGNSPSKLNRNISFKHPEDYGTIPESKSYGDPDFDLQSDLINPNLPVIYSTNNPAVAIIVNNKVHIVGLGSFVLTLSVPADDTYNAAPNVNVNYNVIKGAPIITFPAIPAKSITDADFDPGASNSKGLPLIYTSSNTAVATIVDGKIHILSNGTTTITASQDGTDYYVARSASSLLNVSSTSQTISFPPIPDKNLNATNFGPGASASSGLPITYTSSNTAVATIVNGLIHVVGAGTTIITATQVGNAIYLGVSASASFTVTKIAQNIIFPELKPRLLTSADFWPAAVAFPSGDVTYTSSNLAVATIVNGFVHITGVGTTIITALQPGTDRIAPAVPVGRTLTILKSPQIVTFPDIEPKLITDHGFYPQATATPGFTITYLSSDHAVATVSGDVINIVGSGISIITASLVGNDSYDPANDVSKTLVVQGMRQTVSFPNVIFNKAFGDSDFDPEAVATSGLPISYTSSNLAVATIVTGKVHIVGVGTTEIMALQAGSATVNTARDTITLIVSKSSQIISFAPISTKLKTDPDFDPGATASSGLAVSYSSDNPAVATIIAGKIHIVGSGVAVILATQVGDANYNGAANIDRVLTVNKGIQSITFPDLPAKATSDPDFDPGATANSGLNITYTSSNPIVANIVSGKIHIVGLGTSTITATQIGDSNYNAAADVSKTLTVSATSQTLSFAPLPAKTFGDSDFDPGAIASSGLSITYTSSNLAVATIIAGKVHIIGAGNTNITALQSGNSTYSSTSNTVTLNVNKSNQTISFAPITPKLRTDPDFDPAATASSGLTVSYTSNNLAVATVVAGKIHIVGVGSVVVTATQVGGTNFNAATSIDQSLTINKGPQTITFPALPIKTTSGGDFDPGATTTSNLTLTYTSSNPAVAIIVSGKIHIISSGTSTITATQSGDTNYDPAANVIQTLTVVGASQVVSFATLPFKTISDADFDPGATASSGLSITYSSSNLAVATIVGNKIHIVGVGTTNITALQSGNSAYASASEIRPLTVNKVGQAIAFGSLPTKSRTDSDFDPGAITSSGLAVTYTSSNNSVAIIIADKVHITGAGSTLITATQLGNGTFSAATPVTQNLTIEKGSQTISFPEIASKAQNNPDFDPGATTSSGLTVTYISSNLAVAIIINNKIHIVGLGASTITAIQSGDDSFIAAEDVSKTLIVSGMQQTISFAQIPNKTLQDPDFDLGATASSGLPVSYSSSDITVAIIIGNKIHILGGGTTVITATQSGDSTFIAAAPVFSVLIVNKNTQTITLPTIATKELNSADFDPGATVSSGLAITYTSSNSAVATIIAGKVHIVGAGSTTIIASQGGNSNFEATSTSTSLTVNKAAQSITFPTIANKNYTDADFDPVATASSGLAVSYKSSNTSVATVIGNKIHIVAAGLTVITASQVGNSNYNAATDVSQNLIAMLGLPANNFSVKATDETCKTSDNGSIDITAAQALAYTATVTGNSKTTVYQFTSTLQVANLQAGTYNVCFTLASQPSYKQCFDVVIKEPKDLAVYSSLKNDGNTVVLKLEGSDSYTINLNGQTLTTTQQEITLPLIKGNNSIKVSSNKSCQGIIEKTFITTNEILVYPNPVKDVLNINTGSTEFNTAKVEIYSLDGRLILRGNYKPTYGTISLDLSKMQKGLYVLMLTVGDIKTAHKIIKN